MRREELLDYLAGQTKLLGSGVDKTPYTALDISARFGVKRNTISHYLNLMLEGGHVVKVNSRPVCFIHKQIFEDRFHPLDRQIYKSFDDLMEQQSSAKPTRQEGGPFKKRPPSREDNEDFFNALTGACGSLKRAVEQVRMAALYPDNGLPLIISGPTGVGKSYLARLMHEFCIHSGILAPEASFVVLNCAQYANNPELLSANLFGYVKGAFTGADKTTPGLLEAADGGTLFLDEVHRLNPEGQEKLFVFMDTGSFRRLGESRGGHQANVRLVFATTKPLAETFLETFLRRVPVSIELPSLEQRGKEEKLELLYRRFIEEAKTLGCSICLPERVLDMLVLYRYPGSVGELINTVKYICAKAYAENGGSDRLALKMHILPDKLLNSGVEVVTQKIGPGEDIIIHPGMEPIRLLKKEHKGILLIRHTLETVLEAHARYKNKAISRRVFEETVLCEVDSLADALLFITNPVDENAMMRYITASIREAFRYMEYSLNRKFNSNSSYAVAAYFHHKSSHSIRWDPQRQEQLHSLYHYTIKYNGGENSPGKKLTQLVADKHELSLLPEDEIFLSFYCKGLVAEKTHNIKAVVLAHGNSTASSIANFVNRVLGGNVLEAFDMPLGTTLTDLSGSLVGFIKEHDVSKGLIILVDTGSLKDIYVNIKKYVVCPTAIVNNVSTQMAMDVGEMVNKGMYLEDIVEKLKLGNETGYDIIYPKKKLEKALITSCFTGIGTAVKLQKLLQRSIPASLNINVIAHDYDKLKLLGMQEALFSLYDVIGVVGTLDPEIENIRFISLEDLISGRGKNTINKIFHGTASEAVVNTINDNFVRNFSLENVMGFLTILDTEKLMRIIEQSFTVLERLFEKPLPNDKKLALYIHVSCMIERLIRREETVGYPNLEKFQQCQKEIIEKLKEAFRFIESTYSVNITITEIALIYDILHAKTQDLKKYF